MALVHVPDVHSMYDALFPGGEILGEALAILRDAYVFLARYLDPEEGGRAFLLAILSLMMTVAMMIQRRLGNVKSLFLTGLVIMSIHGSMITLMGSPWVIYPILEYFRRSQNVGGLVSLMSFLSVFVGWGQECSSGSSSLRQKLSGRLGFSDFPDTPWIWSTLFFGLIFSSVGVAFYRCE